MTERLTEQQVADAIVLAELKVRSFGDEKVHYTLPHRALLQVSADLSAAKAIGARLRELRPCNGLSHPADGNRWDYHICLRKTGADRLIIELRSLLPEEGR